MGCGVVERHLEMAQPTKKQEQQQLKSFFGSLAFGRRPKMKIQNYIGLEPVFFTTIFLVNS